MLPRELHAHIEASLEEKISSASGVSGGSINRAARIELEKAGSCFVKWNDSAPASMFEKEVHGLALLKDAGTPLVIPDVIQQGVTGSGIGYLVLEYIKEGYALPGSAETFGKSLAELHSRGTDCFGLETDNYIGKLPQSNRPHSDWTSFFIEERMEPQLRLALDSGKLSEETAQAFHNMYGRLGDIFPAEEPAMLHGDLWGGNYFYNEEGQAVLYDPAVYYGNREMEIAFTQLFGGFQEAFYEAYEEAWPMSPGFSKRKEIYNLYPLLVHTNLFGGSYGRQVVSIVRQFR